jgi:hypothetical protein
MTFSGPKQLKNILRKSDHYFRRRPLLKKIHKGYTSGGCAPFCFGIWMGQQLPSSPIIFWTCKRLKFTSGRSGGPVLPGLKNPWLYLNLLINCSTLKSVWMENQCKIVIFGNFEMSPRCHRNRKFKIVHAVTKGMVQSTLVLIMDYWIIFYSFIAIWTCNRSLFNENGNFFTNAHAVMG